MDGRVQLPVIHWIKENYAVDYVDMITEAGMDGVLVDENYSNMDRIDISLTKHNSNIIFIVGHHDGGGNPVDDETHKKQILIAVEKIKRLRHSPLGLWVSNEGKVEEITKK
ncbi:MAG TPA: hypothetical protein HA299_02765 [Methermicoccus shengliensis]|uniref:Uncharacterized protein n=2 Tax=Methermicoccus shengliensis TaxID=660064 RepID=A0A832RW40_9EURY|nr:carbonic anhydrase [Methermicoccus shengliensis]HIH69534.1 hypothetical protein [Methermicoccus shengliensis]